MSCHGVTRAQAGHTLVMAPAFSIYLYILYIYN